MRRCLSRTITMLLIALFSLSLLGQSTALADSQGWVKRGDHYVHWKLSLDAPELHAPLPLWQSYIQARHDAIRDAIQANIKYEKWLAHQRWLAQHQPEPTPAPQGAAQVPSGSCEQLIAQIFGAAGHSVSYALYVADRESGCYAGAYNPTPINGSHASGVFQILYPFIWEIWDGPCGFEGSSPFNMYANIAVASCMVTHIGWGPWAL